MKFLHRVLRGNDLVKCKQNDLYYCKLSLAAIRFQTSTIRSLQTQLPSTICTQQPSPILKHEQPDRDYRTKHCTTTSLPARRPKPHSQLPLAVVYAFLHYLLRLVVFKLALQAYIRDSCIPHSNAIIVGARCERQILL